ncbi:MAG: cation:proton antiporter [bacterium]
MAILRDIALAIIFSVAAAHVVRFLKQPLILGYVLGGILIGNKLGLGLVSSEHSIEFISEIGLIFLLFIIGLEIKIQDLAKMGKSSIFIGLFQFLSCLILGLFVFKISGAFPQLYDSLYLGIGLALSSTLIVVKLLNDKFETFTTAGKLTVSILVLQDIWAIIFMAVQPNLQSPQIGILAFSFLKGFLIVGAAFYLSGHVLRRVFSAAAKSSELVLLTAIAWCFLVCIASEKAGLSKEMGALIAGVSIAAFPYGTEVIGKLCGIRDFFVTLFFVALGMKIPALSPGNILTAAGLSIFVLASRLLSIPFITAKLGLGTRTGIVSALNLSQISEFSLVILALGAGYGHVSGNTQAVLLTAMLISAVAGTYFIYYNDRLAALIMRLSGTLHSDAPRGVPDAKKTSGASPERDIVLLGCFREGMFLLSRIDASIPEFKPRIMVVDFNPSLKGRLEKMGYKWKYGDISNHSTLSHLGLNNASIIICAIPDVFLKGTTNMALLKQLRKAAPKAKKIMMAEDVAAAESLKKEGADRVIIPAEVAGDFMLESLKSLA